MKRFWLVFCLLLALLCLLAACKQEHTIAKSEVINGELILTYSDGSTENLGSVVNALAQNAQTGESEATCEKGETGAQGEKGETGAQGPQGERGEAGITPQIRINEDSNEWEISTDNGQSWTSTGVAATGAQGPQGENVASLPAENLQELAFYPLPDGTYAVGMGNSTLLTEIVIPATYKGKAVTKIVKNGFRAHQSLVSITIPASITHVEEYAFHACKSLKSVCFEENTQLTDVGISAFSSCEALKSITIPASVTSIGAHAFSGCTVLSNVTFESTEGWWVATAADATSGTLVDVSKPTKNDALLLSTYCDSFWRRTTE